MARISDRAHSILKRLARSCYPNKVTFLACNTEPLIWSMMPRLGMPGGRTIAAGTKLDGGALVASRAVTLAFQVTGRLNGARDSNGKEAHRYGTFILSSIEGLARKMIIGSTTQLPEEIRTSFCCTTMGMTTTPTTVIIRNLPC